MCDERNSDDAAFPARIMCQFVQSVDDGNVRWELAEDCILNLFSRSVKGIDAVTGYMRSQMTGRFNHMGFEQTERCDGSQELQLIERFGRSFQVLNRRIRIRKDLESESVSQQANDSGDDLIDAESNVTQLITPMRNAPTDQSLVLVKFIQSVGMIEACHAPNDGGLDFAEMRQVRITLGYRHNPTDERITDICLVVYEKWPLPAYMRASRPRHTRMRSNFRSTHTDDEGEEPAPRSVRRTLFSSKECDEPEEIDRSRLSSNGEVSCQSPLTPCKRQHKPDTKVKAKRQTGLGGMRF